MKTWICLTVVAVIGMGAGAWSAWAEFQQGELFVPHNGSKVETAPSEDAPEVVVVNGETFNFGVMTQGTTMKHEFQFKNMGQGPLEIWAGESSCTCTVASVTGEASLQEGPSDESSEDTQEHVVLQPGETTDVQLRWKAKNSQNPNYRQAAEILTNDPARPKVRLTIKGTVEYLVQLDPDEIKLTNASVQRGGAGSTLLLWSTEPMPEILDAKLAHESTADQYEFHFEPLTKEELVSHDPAKSGVRIVVRLKPGLPVGAANQLLRITVDEASVGTIDVPIVASVASDLSIIGGADYRRQGNFLDWGLVSRAKGRESKLFVVVKGEHRNEVKLAVERIDPEDSLQVEIGEPRDPDARVLTYPLTVRLAPDCPTMRRLGRNDGLAEVVLSTQHPTAKKLSFQVRFAVN